MLISSMIAMNAQTMETAGNVGMMMPASFAAASKLTQRTTTSQMMAKMTTT